MFDWNAYQAELTKAIPDFVRLSPDSLKGYQTLSNANAHPSTHTPTSRSQAVCLWGCTPRGSSRVNLARTSQPRTTPHVDRPVTHFLFAEIELPAGVTTQDPRLPLPESELVTEITKSASTAIHRITTIIF
jgi:hypothetical protein